MRASRVAEPRAVELLLEGTKALAWVEAQGIPVDTDYLAKAITRAEDGIAALEEALKADPVWKKWEGKYGNKATLGGREQLADVLFGLLKLPYPVKDRTKTGRYRTDDEVLAKVDLPFMAGYRKLMDLQKDRSTYLEGIRREVVNGRFHPTFILHVASTFRSSSGSDREGSPGGGSRDLNFQNLPIRDPARAEMVRRAFVADPGCRIIEIDFSGIEVRVAACYTKDPALIKYIEDPTTDMHRDTAAELFSLPVEFLKEQKDWAKRNVRDWTKNRFVFPEFYGSVFFQCAPSLWEGVTEAKDPIPGLGITLLEHLEKKGIRGLGKCDAKSSPQAGTFEYKCRQVEDSFWKVRFKVYDAWKRSFYSAYQKRGGFRTLTGFWIGAIGGKAGVLKKNDVTNYPIQSAAFHCLLWSLIKIVKTIRRTKMRSKVVGQIHDSVVAVVPDEEVDDFLVMCHRIMTKDLPDAWEWINIPLAVEAEASPVGGSWQDKKPYHIPGT